ncbi:pyridoxamine kinase [Fundicoccus culcitae]|uniref:pyridoxal kinase n=1 Tax=Fundicoccus culcitae TaxID=2969821 RepID=A0ABY5P343_9LACT|nr:pyridoxamine kinase [Fundicoccus culcitae]UUX33117.1 pyridoxamine kinase [Fundicoccus culcitae]
MSNQVLVINDLPGVAKVAGMSNLPILEAAQFEVGLLPTLILSTHTLGYPGLIKHYLNESFDEILNHWYDMNVQFRGCLTGYFADSKQIDTVIDYLEKVDYDLPVIIDPIMADFGKLYAGFSEDFPEKFRKLVKYADIIVPNLTEACLITDYPFSEDLSTEDYPKICQGLVDLGAKNVVLTGVSNGEVHDGEETIGYYVYTPGEEPQYVMHQKFDTWFKGIGDLSVSLIMAYYLLGDTVLDAVKKSTPYMELAIQHSMKVDRDQKLGIYFEPIIPQFANEIQAMRDAL